MINGAFNIIEYDGGILFLKRKDNGLWDLVGGGFDVNEVDYKGVAIREIGEEIGLMVERDRLNLFAVLGQRLPKKVQDEYKVEKGLIFLHHLILHEKPKIILSDEHTDYSFFSYSKILEHWKEFSSGPLWQVFTYLSFKETLKLQEGMLKDRATWLGTTYQ